MSSIPPVQLLINVQTENDALWVTMNRNASGNPGFWPITTKAFYVFGVLRGIFQSAEVLIAQSRVPFALDGDPQTRFGRIFVTYFSGFGVFASGVELLGRCLAGVEAVEGQSGRCLALGFNWLLTPGRISDDRNTIIITTERSSYAVRDLTGLRNFVSHGQATSSGREPFLDFQLMTRFPEMLGDAMETYWTFLTRESEELCYHLARANILPVNLGQPITQTLVFFSQSDAGRQFRRLDFS